MNWNTIKLDAADIAFSKFIRLRDKACVACGRSGYGDLGITGLQASHFYSRRNESVRFDPENVDALDAGCHRKWGGEDRLEYRDFKIKQLGQKGFDLLTLRANTYQKRDRKMSLIQAKLLLKTL